MINMKVLLLVIVSAAVSPVAALSPPNAAFNVSLELQGDCSDQLTLICRHSDILSDPDWIHNGTTESGQLLDTAFPGAMYSFQNNTEARVTITRLDNVTALDGYIIQCVYSIRGNLIKSNAVKYSFVPPDYRPALSLVSVTAVFSERLSTFTCSYQESCSLYPRCTPYFSVEHTVSPQSVVSNSSSGCSVEYTIHSLMRCVSYQSTATTLFGNQRGIPIVVGDTVMLSPSQFTITSVSIGVDRNFINVTYMENEPDCPGYPTERFTVDVDGESVADLTADAVQSLAINHANSSVTLSLPLNRSLPEDAVTLNMTKYNTVPTNRSDVTGNIVTEMVTWRTSAVFELSQESSAAMNDEGAVSVGVVVGIILPITIIAAVLVSLNTVVILAVIALRQKAKQCGTVDIKPTNDPPNEVQPQGRPGCGPTPAAASQGPQPVKDVVSDEVVKPLPPSAAETVDETLEVCEPEEESHPVTESTKQPKVDLTRGNPAGVVVPQKTICAFRDDASTGFDDISGDKAIPQGQRTTQGLTYVTVDHSRPRPINAPNENLDVQYTGVKFDTKAPAV